ncbi:MAG TPA: hypothetical protein VFI61_00085 [Patescibacteria group bacterium]|nr:hypothetical protein [Patescibacteria group bacterium]
MQKFSKFIFFLFIVLSIFTISYSLLAYSANAQATPEPANTEGAFPKLHLKCTETRPVEFQSLRPYQAAPCGDAPKAIFCSNKLKFIEDIDVTKFCHRQGSAGTFICDGFSVHINPHDLFVTLDQSQFPIMGNTEDVINHANQTDSIDDATKVNEYVSWYLNGVIDKAENKDSTADQIVNLSGPVRKLLPSVIQDVNRIKTIDTATRVTSYYDPDLNKIISDANNHDQIVVDNERLTSWNDNLSLFRELANIVKTTDAWDKRTPPLPWSDMEGKPFKSDILFKKAYQEWRGKSCIILPIVGLQCLDLKIQTPLGTIDFVTNKYADLWRFVPLANTTDKKGANFLVTLDGPSYDAAEGTTLAPKSAQHKSYTNAPLYFAHTQEVMDLSEELNKTYTPANYKSEKIPDTTEVNNCSALTVRANKGDNLFPGDDIEISVTGAEYTVTSGKCVESPPKYECRGAKDPREKPICKDWPGEFKCNSEVAIILDLATKTPFADEIFASTVADSGSTFRKIFPKVEVGAPVSCIADIPTVTGVTYDPAGSQLPRGDEVTGTQEFKVERNPEDRAGETPELTFPHIGSVYEYFLKGIQTALRPKGYGTPIEDGKFCAPTVPTDCKVNVPDSAVPKNLLGNFKTNFIDLADKWTVDCPGAVYNLADECYNYVAVEANKKGINPAFALTIWLNESGASNYCHGGITTQDFGVNLFTGGSQDTSVHRNIVKQLELFLKLAKTKWCEGMSGFDEPMQGWLSRFQSSNGVCDPKDTKAMDYADFFESTTWTWVTGCPKNGKFGITWPTDKSCPK